MIELRPIMALYTLNETRDSYVLSVPVPHKYVVNEMPVLQSGMHPRRPVTGREVEDGVRDQKTMFMFCTGLEE